MNISGRQVFGLIYRRGAISRAEIARQTGLTAPSVSEIVAGLTEQGLVVETGLGPSSGGKRPRMLQVPDEARWLVGLDLAHGDFRGALLNLRGEVKLRLVQPLEGRRGDAALALAYQLVDRLVRTAERPLLGMGVGAPGLVDASAGLVYHAVNVDWHALALGDLLQARYGLPVAVANDCQAAVLAERLFGSGAGARGEDETLVVINTGQGVGAGILVDGRLLHGHPYGAGEIGHLVVASGGEPCVCGNAGCLETVASDWAMRGRAARLGIELPEGQEMSVLGQRSLQGDAAARRVVEESGRALGIAAANLVGVLGRCRIALAGSLAVLGEPLLEAMRAEMVCRVVHPVAQETEICMAGAGDDLVMRGAAVLVLSNELGL